MHGSCMCGCLDGSFITSSFLIENTCIIQMEEELRKAADKEKGAEKKLMEKVVRSARKDLNAANRCEIIVSIR